MSVFDSSALIAILRNEPGSSGASEYLDGSAHCSAANWSEVAQKIRHYGIDWPVAREVLLSRGLEVVPVTAADAEDAAGLWAPGSGLSLADRLCIALGRRLGEQTITCDSAWAVHPHVVVIR